MYKEKGPSSSAVVPPPGPRSNWCRRGLPPWRSLLRKCAYSYHRPTPQRGIGREEMLTGRKTMESTNTSRLYTVYSGRNKRDRYTFFSPSLFLSLVPDALQLAYLSQQIDRAYGPCFGPLIAFSFLQRKFLYLDRGDPPGISKTNTMESEDTQQQRLIRIGKETRGTGRAQYIYM